MRRTQSQSLGTTTAQRPTPIPKIVPGVVNPKRPRIIATPPGSRGNVRPMPTARYAWSQVQPAATLADLLADVPPALDVTQLNKPIGDLLQEMPVAQYLAQSAPVQATVAQILNDSSLATTPAAAPQTAAPAGTRSAKPASTVVPRYAPQYQELPESPELQAAPAVPVRDLIAEKEHKDGAQSLALLGPLAALLTGGSISNAAQYVPVNLAAALSGAQAGNNRTYARDVQQYDLQRDATQQENANDLAQYGREVAAANAHNGIEARREQQSIREQAAATKADADRRQERREFLKQLADLDPASQTRVVAASLQNGELARLGVELPTDEAGNFVPIVKATPAGTLTADQKIAQGDKQRETENLRGELRTQYGLLTNPRITPAGAEQARNNIEQIQKQLGYTTDADASKVLNEFTPEQRTQIGLAKKRLALQQQNAANLEAYRNQTIEQRNAKAKQSGAAATKKAGGNPAVAFRVNQNLLSGIELKLSGRQHLTPQAIAALEYQRATLTDQQAYLSEQVAGLSTATRTRGGLPGGKPVAQRTQPGGRVTAALASAKPKTAPAATSKPAATPKNSRFTRLPDE